MFMYFYRQRNPLLSHVKSGQRKYRQGTEDHHLDLLQVSSHFALMQMYRLRETGTKSMVFSTEVLKVS